MDARTDQRWAELEQAERQRDTLVAYLGATIDKDGGMDFRNWVGNCHEAEAALQAARAEVEALKAQNLALRRAINDYRAGIMALNPALSVALVAHLPEPQGGDSEY